MAIQGRKFSGSSGYRYGFNGMEKDDEIKGNGNSYDFGARMYDSRLGRFLSIDPRVRDFPWQSPYVFADNNPTRMIDVDGEGAGDKVKVADVKKALSAVPDEGATYQFTLYVDQPKKGSRRKLKLPSDVGHTFIKIVKTSADGKQVVEQVFGYYPAKTEGALAGSPVNPEAVSTFRDNIDHGYDETITKTDVTKGQIDKIIEVAQGYENAPYCLAGQNCTNFGVDAAGAAGIKLPLTQGKIPLTGRGVTPADLGQDILEGKVEKQEGVTVGIESGTAKAKQPESQD